jgi:hypothetical protein
LRLGSEGGAVSFWAKKPVMILGCGPAGLFAAQAALDAGYPLVIFSRRRKSEMFGAQYLHGEVPNLPAHGFTIQYLLEGTAKGYAAKVYGPESAESMASQVSPARLIGQHKAWDIREAYDRAWDRFQPYIVDTLLSAKWLDNSGWRDHSLVISSIPATQICRAELDELSHDFHVAEVWAIGDAPEKDVSCPVRMPYNTVTCNGEPSPSWYRASNVNGFHTCEWPASVKPPFTHIARVSKPLSTNCNCWTNRKTGPQVLRVGRYGTWTKGVLSHDAYDAVRARLS